MAHSSASAPELVKNMVSAKVAAVIRAASFSAPGMRNRLDTCHSFVACSESAAAR